MKSYLNNLNYFYIFNKDIENINRYFSWTYCNMSMFLDNFFTQPLAGKFNLKRITLNTADPRLNEPVFTEVHDLKHFFIKMEAKTSIERIINTNITNPFNCHKRKKYLVWLIKMTQYIFLS